MLSLASWTKEENWHLMHTLLSLIEDNPTWKVVLSFNKGDASLFSSGGKKLTNHYCAIVKKLFLDPVESTWEECDLAQLKDVMKNHINR